MGDLFHVKELACLLPYYNIWHDFCASPHFWLGPRMRLKPVYSSTLNSVNHPQSPTYVYSNIFSHFGFQVPLNTSFLIKLWFAFKLGCRYDCANYEYLFALKFFVIEYFVIAIYVSTNRGNIQHELFYINVTLIYICLLLIVT